MWYLRCTEQLTASNLALGGCWCLKPLPFEFAPFDSDNVFDFVRVLLVVIIALSIFRLSFLLFQRLFNLLKHGVRMDIDMHLRESW